MTVEVPETMDPYVISALVIHPEEGLSIVEKKNYAMVKIIIPWFLNFDMIISPTTWYQMYINRLYQSLADIKFIDICNWEIMKILHKISTCFVEYIKQLSRDIDNLTVNNLWICVNLSLMCQFLC